MEVYTDTLLGESSFGGNKNLQYPHTEEMVDYEMGGECECLRLLFFGIHSRLGR